MPSAFRTDSPTKAPQSSDTVQPAAGQTPASGPAPRWRRGWRLGVAVAAATLAVALLALLVEPTLLRPLIQHLLRNQSGRAIDFSALRLRLDHHFEPRIELDDLVLDNAPWSASHEPMVRARKAALELTWEGVASGVWTVRRLVLEDASIDIERDAQGRRNTRLSSGDGRGRSRAQVLSVDARRSRLQILDAVTGFELRIASAPLAAPAPAGRPDLPLTRLLTFEGRQRGVAFDGEARTSDTLTLRQTAADFAVRAEIRSASSRLKVEGALADLLAPTHAEVDLHLDADPLAGFRPAPPLVLPGLRQVSADAHLSLAARRWAFTRLHARSARSEVTGNVEFRPGSATGERPKLLATLAAARLDLAELVDAEGAKAAQALVARAAGPAALAKPAAVAPPPARAAASTAPAAAGSAPAAAFDWTGLGKSDAEVDLRIAKLVAPRGIVADDTRLQATLDHALLKVALLASSIAGGQATGRLQLDAAKSPAAATLDLRVAGVQLSRLPVGAIREQLGAGTLAATAALSAHGRSMTEVAAGASGTLNATVDGATISDRLEATLGLDGAGFLRSLVSGKAQVPLRCATLALVLQAGHATIRDLALDTPRTAITGRGSLDLVGRTLDIVLVPSSRVDAVLSLDRNIRIQGPMRHPRLSLQARAEKPAAVPCRVR